MKADLFKERICPASDAQMLRSVRDMTLEHRGRSEMIGMAGWYCDECGEGVHSGEDMEQLLAAMTPDALDSENQTIIQSYTCQISVSGQTATESCAGASGEFQNTYALGPNGRIQSSRQWTTPEIGFLRIVQVK